MHGTNLPNARTSVHITNVSLIINIIIQCTEHMVEDWWIISADIHSTYPFPVQPGASAPAAHTKSS